MNEYIKKNLPPPFRAQGQQLSYNGDDKVFCDLYSIEQVVEFAELIVKECMAAVQEEKDTGMYNAKEMTGMSAAKAIISFKFGV